MLDASWELPASGEIPRAIATSPDGRFVAGQWGQVAGAGHAAVWDVASKQIVWRPDGATALCWVGDEVLVTRLENKREVIDVHDAMSRARTATVAIRYPIGAWLTHAPTLVASPAGGLAAVRWLDQSEAGFEVLRRTDQGWSHVAAWSYQIPCNLASDLRFDDTGSYLAMVWANPRDPFDWWQHPRSDGSHLAAVLAVMRMRDGAVGNLPYFVRPARGWKPDRKASPAPEIAGFSGDRLEVVLQTGERVVRSVAEAELEPPEA